MQEPPHRILHSAERHAFHNSNATALREVVGGGIGNRQLANGPDPCGMRSNR